MQLKVNPLHTPSPENFGVLMTRVREQIDPVALSIGVGITFERYSQDWANACLLLRVHGPIEYCIRTHIQVDYMSYKLQSDVMTVVQNLSGYEHFCIIGHIYTGCYLNEPTGTKLADRIAEQVNEALHRLVPHMDAVSKSIKSPI
jgi:hypothetical protein